MAPSDNLTARGLALRLSLSLFFLAAPAAGASRYVGCFHQPVAAGTLAVQQPSSRFQAVGLCAMRCNAAALPLVALTNGTDCLCGAALPSWGEHAHEHECNVLCPGYGQNFCGGEGTFSIHFNEQLASSEETPRAQQATEPAATLFAVPEDFVAQAPILGGGSGL